MSLVLYGCEPLDILKKWVNVLFSPARNLGIQAPSFTGHPTGPNQLHQICRVKPVRDLRYLEVIFALPATEPHFRIKPVKYFAHLVGHEGGGSLLSALKKRGWALGLSSYNSYNASSFDHFCVQVDLTEDGFENYEKVYHFGLKPGCSCRF